MKDMTTSRAYVERNEEDNEEQEVPLQAPPQAPVVPIGEYVSNEKIRLSRYAPSIMADPRMKMSKFVLGVSDLIPKECSMDMLENDMNIDRLVIHAQRFEREKLV
uniref:Gag-pol polyprotein n=1 Tax=Solanum tuberosum TaxID=4113 RepID=M1DRU6_SOLTU